MLDKIKELSKDTAIYGISTIFGRFLSFLLVPFYTNVFTTSEYGIFAYLYTILAFMNIVYIYGMDAAFLKYTSLAKEKEKKDTFSTPFLFVVSTSLLASILFFIFKAGVSNALDVPQKYSHLFIYIILILLLDTFALIPFSKLRLERKAKKFATIKIINILINLTLNIVLILYYKMGIEAIFISNLCASAFSFLALIPDIVSRLKFKIDKNVLKKMLKFGLPYLPASIAAMMVQMIDVPILRELTNDATVGIYRANYKLGIFMMLFVSMFQYAWQPFFLNNAKEKNAKEIFSKVLSLFVLVASVIWIVISLFIDNLASIEILPGKTIIGHSFLSGIFIVPVVLLAYLFYGMYVNFTAGLYIEEKTQYFPYVTITGALVNVVINLFLIPIYGIMGAALATLASYIVMAAGMFFVSNKFYKINYEYRRIFPNIIIMITILLFYYYFYSIGILNLFIKFLLLIGFVFSLVFFRVIKKKELLSAFTIIFRK